MSDSAAVSSDAAPPASLFAGEVLARYLAVHEGAARGRDVSEALSALVEILEHRLEELTQAGAAFERARALMQRVSFEILQQLARRVELGNALPSVARLLGRASVCPPLALPRFCISQDWFFDNVPKWQQLFAEHAGRPGLNCLEIGSFEGMSACWLLENVLTHATSRIVCIDPFDAPGQPQAERYFDHNVRLTGQAHKLTKLKGYSKQVLPLLDGSRFHIAYIDGSHHPTHALEDALAVWPLLEPGALAIFDDYAIGAFYPPELARESDPKPGIDAFLGFVAGQYRELDRGYQLVLQKL